MAKFIFLLLLFVAAVVACYGWIHNIVIVCHSDFGHIGGMLVVRIIGIFMPPLGVVMGFIS